MLVINKRIFLLEHLNLNRSEGKTIGFVPTMGALHDGHVSLVKRAKMENDIAVASIFINPTQFNNPEDLKHYPRTLDEDKKMLMDAGCDILFFPETDEMYPQGLKETSKDLDLGGLENVMEGAHRPGHFMGVIQVVKKLFDAVGPCKSYFGEKDFQQLAVVRKMVKEWQLPIEIIGCPIVRENDGLAMSSRNTRLSIEERKIAPLISSALFQAKEMWRTNGVEEIKEKVSQIISAASQFRLEYFEISDAETLQPIRDNQKTNVVGCIAVQLGNVRLIDNIMLG
ncbi:pantoate--beta-alanine ligase [soil metagenome]